MRLRDWKECVDKEFPAVPPVNAETKEVMRHERARCRGSVRLANAMVWDDAEFEEFRRTELATPLP